MINNGSPGNFVVMIWPHFISRKRSRIEWLQIRPSTPVAVFLNLIASRREENACPNHRIARVNYNVEQKVELTYVIGYSYIIIVNCAKGRFPSSWDDLFSMTDVKFTEFAPNISPHSTISPPKVDLVRCAIAVRVDYWVVSYCVIRGRGRIHIEIEKNGHSAVWKWKIVLPPGSRKFRKLTHYR